MLLKSGRSTTGKRSAGSHTGALAGISEVARTAFERAGIIVIENSDELFPVAETLSSLPPIKNNRVAILADGGGHATIAADLLTDLGVEIPELSEQTQEQLRKILPADAALPQPGGRGRRHRRRPRRSSPTAPAIMLEDHAIGGLLIVGLFGGYGIRFAESLALIEEDAAHRMGKLVQKRRQADRAAQPVQFGKAALPAICCATTASRSTTRWTSPASASAPWPSTATI